VKVVAGMFHHRLDYPATRHITEAPKDDTPPSKEVGEETLLDPSEPPIPGDGQPQEASLDASPTPGGKAGPDEDPRDEQLPLTPPDDPPPPESDDG